jgi:predicted DNA-binding protein
MKNELKRYNIHLQINQHDKLEKLAEKTGMPVALHVRLAINKYLKGKEL